jgi:hypothetical protein
MKNARQKLLASSMQPKLLGTGRGVAPAHSSPLMFTAKTGGGHPAVHLSGFSGLLQVDGHVGFVLMVIADRTGLKFAFCWAHARRRFYDIHLATKAPFAEDALRRIAASY